MNRLSIEEFKNNIDDIIENGLKEEIVIYDGEKELFSIVPQSQRLMREWENFLALFQKKHTIITILKENRKNAHPRI